MTTGYQFRLGISGHSQLSVIRILDTLAKTRSTQRERRLMIENEIGKGVVDIAVQIHRETVPS